MYLNAYKITGNSQAIKATNKNVCHSKRYIRKWTGKLAEPVPAKEEVSVTVTFPEIEKPLQKNEMKFGSLAGKITIPENFDDEPDEFKKYF